MRLKMAATLSVLAVAVMLAGCGRSEGGSSKTVSSSRDPKEAADQLLSSGQQFIADTSYSFAEGNLEELEKLRPKLPAEYGPKIDKFKADLAAAKAGKK